MSAVLAAVALLGGSVHPWPVGPGPRYTPSPSFPAVLAGRPLAGLRCTSGAPSFKVHVELFAGRRAVVVPAGVGVAEPLTRSGARVLPRGCSYPVRTTAPDGIVEVRGRTVRLADLFRVWGRALGAHRLLAFGSSSPVRAYVDGRLVEGPPGRVVLRPDAQIVLEIRGYVPPHPFFLFTGGDS